MTSSILVIDDEASIRNLLSDFFAQHGFEVASTGAVEEATEAEELRPDVILLDISLEESCGLDQLKNLKSKFLHIPIIIMTGMGYDRMWVRAARAAGVDGYFSKSQPLEELLEMVTKVLNNPAV